MSLFVRFCFVVKGLCITEIKILGDISYLQGGDIKYYRETLASNLAIKDTCIRYCDAGDGCFVLVFQLPNAIKKDILLAAKNREQWLREANIVGLHIEGEPYVSLMDMYIGKTLTFIYVDYFFSFPAFAKN